MIFTSTLPLPDDWVSATFLNFSFKIFSMWFSNFFCLRVFFNCSESLKFFLLLLAPKMYLKKNMNIH